jgi:excisionase family DNA binding protein
MEPVCIDQQIEPLIGADEAAKYLGFSPLTVRRMAHEGRLPSIPFPRGKGKYQHRFRISDLKAYVEMLAHTASEPHRYEP